MAKSNSLYGEQGRTIAISFFSAVDSKCDIIGLEIYEKLH